MKFIKKTILTILIMLLLSILVQLNNNVYGIEINEHSETITIIESMSKKLIGDVSVNTVEYLYNLDGSPDYIYVRYKTMDMQFFQVIL